MGPRWGQSPPKRSPVGAPKRKTRTNGKEEEEVGSSSRKAKREAGGRRSKKGKLHHEPYQPVLSYKYKGSGDSTVHLLTHKSDALVKDWRKPTEQNGRKARSSSERVC